MKLRKMSARLYIYLFVYLSFLINKRTSLYETELDIARINQIWHYLLVVAKFLFDLLFLSFLVVISMFDLIQHSNELSFAK